MSRLREKIRSQIPEMRAYIKNEFLSKYADTVIGNVTVKQMLGGMRGVTALVCNSSFVDPYKGLHIRGIPLAKLTDTIPEEIFYLLCTGELPEKPDLEKLQEELRIRSEVPEHVWDVLYALPKDTHPMTMFSIAIMAMEGRSIFKAKYAEGMRKADYWEATLDDALEIIAKIPAIAAGIYRIRYSLAVVSISWLDAGDINERPDIRQYIHFECGN